MKMSEYKQLFLSEAGERLDSLNNVLVRLEKEPTNRILLNELFRDSHTLKSLAQSMGYEDISKLTHSMETTLAALKSGELKVDKSVVDPLFSSLDALAELVMEVKKGEKTTPPQALQNTMKDTASVSLGEQKPVRGKHLTPQPAAENRRSTKNQHDINTVRIPVTQLDSIMDVTGELLINRIRLVQLTKTIENKHLTETVAQLSRLTSRLQQKMMQMRLVPLEYIFIPYPRMIRDLAAHHNKKVDLLIEGSHIGLDRSIQDEINESLLHLLKNAVIHGIESPAERNRLGKPARSVLKLSARRKKNHVVIELTDDGRGIDIEELKTVALKRGIIKKEELMALTPKETIMLITAPGYSRAEKVTEAAGRGVGLNASRIKVESFGGTFNIESRPNEGTTFFIKLPLTMAIVQAMLVGIADETYCIPLSYITETLKVSPAEIKAVEHCEAIAWRDTVLPIIRMREKFGFPPLEFRPSAPDLSGKSSTIPLLVVEVGAKRFGLVVDTLLGQQDTVIKPLTGILEKLKGTSGATILSTSKVALIVDVPSLL